MNSCNKKISSVACLLFLVILTKTFAQPPQKPHIHGVSNLDIAFENKSLNMELKTPLMDIVGFEERPKTIRQKKAFDIATGKLKNWEDIFTFKGGSCKNNRILLQTGHEKEKHTHKHKNHSKSNEDIHSDLKVFYGFNCDNSSNLKHIEVLLFKQFPQVQEISVQWVTTNGQGQKLLNRAKNRIILR